MMLISQVHLSMTRMSHGVGFWFSLLRLYVYFVRRVQNHIIYIF